MDPEIYESERAITAEDIAQFEARYKLRLPEAYKQFLMQHNGGVPEPDFLPVDGEHDTNLACFYSLKYGVARIEEALADLKEEDSALPAHLLPIGDDMGGNQICLSLADADFGHVYFWLHDDDLAPIHLADSFSGFLQKLSTGD